MSILVYYVSTVLASLTNLSLSVLREQKEDDDLKQIMHQKGFVLSPLSYETRRERGIKTPEAPLATITL